MRDIELLSPGGSFESVKAAFNAGADAVYTGGTLFGAREYADNLDREQMIEAIDYAHIHNRKLFLTVNTLLKNNEIKEKLYDYILPYYESGLDAVIVQDFGVLEFLHENFNDLPIHASTQMTIMGEKTANYLKDHGVTRIVTPRELSLKEIKNIYDETHMEIESFVHGALCYCYSGQCFLSSYIGGRSGNRGKCAQPCRLNYDVLEENKIINQGDRKYVLSPKDICTLKILPEIVESGVYSLKIEGRMKKPEYTAGITALYRKYIDLYKEKGRSNYRVEEGDIQKAMDLFNRNGFSQSYYKTHNSKDMISLKKPSFRMENETLVNNIRENYIKKQPKEKINIYISLLKNENIKIIALMGEKCVSVIGDIPDLAQKAPLTKETVRKQLCKMGNSPFEVEKIEITMDDGLFVTMGELNRLRRDITEKLTKEILIEHKRYAENGAEKENEKENGPLPVNDENNPKNTKNVQSDNHCNVSVLATKYNQAEAALHTGKIQKLYVEAYSLNRQELEKIIKQAENSNTELYLAMPHVFRMNDEKVFDRLFNDCVEAFRGVLIRNIEEYFYIVKKYQNMDIVFDYNVYTWNGYSKKWLKKLKENALITVPVELNHKELLNRGCKGEEMVTYGYMPAMVSAGCVAKTFDRCKKTDANYVLSDRKSQKMNVRTACRFCYNIIYNPMPLSLMKYATEIKKMEVSYVRLELTSESPEETKKLINTYADAFINDIIVKDEIKHSTRGHFNRGVQ